MCDDQGLAEFGSTVRSQEGLKLRFLSGDWQESQLDHVLLQPAPSRTSGVRETTYAVTVCAGDDE